MRSRMRATKMMRTAMTDVYKRQIPICGKWCRLIGLPPAAVTADAISAVGWAHFSVSYPVRPTEMCIRDRTLSLLYSLT